MSDPLWLLRPPYAFLTVGAFIFLLAVVYTYTGKVWVRFHGWVNRAEEPTRYWGGDCGVFFPRYWFHCAIRV